MPKLRDDWWHTDDEGRRIGWLTPEELRAHMDATYGADAPLSLFAHDLGVDQSKVSRWLTGKDPVPKHVKLLFILKDEAGGACVFAQAAPPWLPETTNVNGNCSLPQVSNRKPGSGRPSKASKMASQKAANEAHTAP